VKSVDESFDGCFYEKALDCLGALRAGCVKEFEAEQLNGFLVQLREKYARGAQAAFWKLLIGRGITLINELENKASTVTLAEAMEVNMFSAVTF